MTKRPTIADLAKASGVSVATVDRVLNGRLPVRAETSRRVYEAATGIGYHAASLIRQQIEQRLPQFRLGFLLQRPEQFFFQKFAETLQKAVHAATGFRGVPIIDFLPDQTPAGVSAKLREMAQKCDAVAMVSVDHAQITGVVADLRGRGVPVFALLSDFASGVRAGYFGIDNRKAGRAAAWMIAKSARRPGKVAVLVGSHRFQGHELREIGLRSYFREHAPEFEVLESYVNLEEARIAHEATLDLLRRYPDLVGLCVAGGGIEGVIAALREDGFPHDLVTVCNEVTPETQAALADGIVTLVLATPIEQLAKELIVGMISRLSEPDGTSAHQVFLPIDLRISETL
jgi:LacI family transcriptional regulator